MCIIFKCNLIEENNMGPDQTAPRKKLICPSSGSILFAISSLGHKLARGVKTSIVNYVSVLLKTLNISI